LLGRVTVIHSLKLAKHLLGQHTSPMLTLSRILLLSVASIAIAFPQTPDEAAIRKTALDYIEGWYSGDAARMERALHRDLAKRIVRTNPQSGQSVVSNQTAAILIQGTKSGGGTRTPAEKQMKDVTILDQFQNAAVVKIVAADWIDYLQVGKVNGEWKIINVLWEMKPRQAVEAKK